MDPVKTGDTLHCSVCGVKLQVVESCDDTCTCNITCCDKIMSVYENEVEG